MCDRLNLCCVFFFFKERHDSGSQSGLGTSDVHLLFATKKQQLPSESALKQLSNSYTKHTEGGGVLAWLHEGQVHASIS